MPQKWSGDGRYYLPARQIEPYRLWFEFLKLAKSDPALKGVHADYSEWGSIEDVTFNDWWEEGHWRQLFAVDVSVRALDVGTVVTGDDHALVVRLPLLADPQDTVEQVRRLLEQSKAGIRLGSGVQGRFRFTAGYERGFLKYLNQANFLLRLYRIWLNNHNLDKKGRVSATAVEFYTWAKRRDDLIKARNLKYTRPLYPTAVRAYVDEIKTGEDTSESDNRRQFVRYLRKARNLAKNAAEGRFPGKFS